MNFNIFLFRKFLLEYMMGMSKIDNFFIKDLKIIIYLRDSINTKDSIYMDLMMHFKEIFIFENILKYWIRYLLLNNFVL